MLYPIADCKRSSAKNSKRHRGTRYAGTVDARAGTIQQNRMQAGRASRNALTGTRGTRDEPPVGRGSNCSLWAVRCGSLTACCAASGSSTESAFGQSAGNPAPARPANRAGAITTQQRNRNATTTLLLPRPTAPAPGTQHTHFWACQPAAAAAAAAARHQHGTAAPHSVTTRPLEV